VVYRAVQPLIEREVAVKIVLPQYADHPDFIRRFEAEAQLVARLEHPYIVPLYDYWREPGVAYLVMRLLRGGCLTDTVKSGPLALEAVAVLLEQIGAALHAAHRVGVIHLPGQAGLLGGDVALLDHQVEDDGLAGSGRLHVLEGVVGGGAWGRPASRAHSARSRSAACLAK